MTPLAARFFAYIWGAIVGTSLVVLALSIWRDQTPPGLLPTGQLEPVLQVALRSEFETGGAARATAFLANQPTPSIHFVLVLQDEPSCTGADVIGQTPDGACLRLHRVDTDQNVFQRVLPFLMPLTTGLAMSMAAAWLLARRFVRPIQHLGDGLIALSQGNLDRRIGTTLAGYEPAIVGLGRAFDVAASKLQDLTESRTQLFHDLSHEIRSPLARLQVQTALLEQNPSRLDALLPRMEADIARMNHLVEEILTLARLEHGQAAALHPVPIDLVDLIDPILRDAELEGQLQAKTVRYVGPEQLQITCYPELVHRAVENILRNGLRYAPQGTEVTVTVVPAAHTVTLTIADQGIGVDERRLTSIFTAFVRDETGQGIGLGLAIAANAIRLHGGTIEARNSPGGGFAVTCTLPQA